MPPPPPQQLNIDRCIRITTYTWYIDLAEPKTRAPGLGCLKPDRAKLNKAKKKKTFLVPARSLFVFRLALRARQNTAQLVKILSDTTQQNI